MNGRPLRHEKVADTRWMVEGACLAHPWLPWTGDVGHARRQVLDLMQAICLHCPVREQCAAYAEEVDITAGWWAGRSLNNERGRVA